MESFISTLRPKVSKDTVILTKADSDFAAANERWTNIDRETPGVIVQPSSEEDVIVLVCECFYATISGKIYLLLTYDPSRLEVKEAHTANVPFVPATGGHSPWSTVRDGMVIDLSHFKEIQVYPDKRTVVIRGGVLMKELQLALTDKGQFTSTPTTPSSPITI